MTGYIERRYSCLDMMLMLDKDCARNLDVELEEVEVDGDEGKL